MGLGEGARFAGYTVERLLGVGGMGEVYLAHHPRLPRREALKILRADVSADTDYRQRFNREADLAAGLFHPHIVGVHDRGEFEGQLWIAMDYVPGHDIGLVMRTEYPGGMPSGEVVAVVSAVAAGLDHAHHRGLMHRDVKPANIMISRSDGDEPTRIMLSDFGIAHTLDDISGLTVTNMTVGTVDYCAPEQLMGAVIDGRADQYALAASAYHMLTGVKLFAQANPVAVISAHLTEPPPSLSTIRPELDALDEIFARALAKNPADRFERCADFGQALAERVQHCMTHAIALDPSSRKPATNAASRPSVDVDATAAGPNVVEPIPTAATQHRHVHGVHPAPLTAPPQRHWRTPGRRLRVGRPMVAAAVVAAAALVAVVVVPRLTRDAEAGIPATAQQQQQAALRAGERYLQALARGDAAAAAALSLTPPTDGRLLTSDVLRAQLAAAPITDIAVLPAPPAPGDNPSDIQNVVLSARFGSTLSQVRIAEHRKYGEWKLDTTIAVDIGSPGIADPMLKSVALWGVASGGASPVVVFPGALEVSSANSNVDITASAKPLLLEALTAADRPRIQPVSTLNDTGRRAAKAALDNFFHYCYRGVAPPPDCVRLRTPNDTAFLDSTGDFTNTTFAFDPYTLRVAVNGRAAYHGHAAGIPNYTVLADVVGIVDLTQDPPVFVRSANNR